MTAIASSSSVIIADHQFGQHRGEPKLVHRRLFKAVESEKETLNMQKFT
jgi:hypothetical protein